MRQGFGTKKHILALATCGILLGLPSTGQNAPTASLQEQLKAQYKLVKTGTDAYGLTVVDPGTVLNVQRGGLLGVSPKSAVFCPA